MGIPNAAVNRLLERPEIFADLMNCSLFGGKQMLKPEDLSPVNGQTGILQEGEKGRIIALERRRDICMKAELGMYSVILANETQENIHYAMPVRNMLYDALEYTRQVQELKKRHREEGDILTGEDFLSGMKKSERLVPVITTVLYCGNDSWDGSSSLYEMLGLDEEEELAKELQNYLPDYKINLIDARNFAHLESLQTCLQYIFSMLKYNKSKEKLYQYVREHQKELKKMDSVELAAAFALLGEQKRWMKLIETKDTKEEMDMCQAIDELIEDGRREGISQGISQGLKLGIREGAAKKMISLVCIKLNKGKESSVIAEELEEPKEKIQMIANIARDYAPEYDVDKIYQELMGDGTRELFCQIMAESN